MKIEIGDKVQIKAKYPDLSEMEEIWGEKIDYGIVKEISDYDDPPNSEYKPIVINIYNKNGKLITCNWYISSYYLEIYNPDPFYKCNIRRNKCN